MTSKIIVLCIVVVSIAFVASIAYKTYRDYKTLDKSDLEVGVKIFGVKMEETDFMAFVNACISYLMINNELDLTDYLDESALRVQSDNEFIILERQINAYPVICCKYIGQRKFVIDKTGMKNKCEKYQKDTGCDDYFVPLFDNRLVTRYGTIFNTATKYQQIKVANEVMKINCALAYDGSSKYRLSKDAKEIKKMDSVVDTSKYLVKRRFPKLVKND